MRRGRRLRRSPVASEPARAAASHQARRHHRSREPQVRQSFQRLSRAPTPSSGTMSNGRHRRARAGSLTVADRPRLTRTATGSPNTQAARIFSISARPPAAAELSVQIRAARGIGSVLGDRASVRPRRPHVPIQYGPEFHGSPVPDRRDGPSRPGPVRRRQPGSQQLSAPDLYRRAVGLRRSPDPA